MSHLPSEAQLAELPVWAIIGYALRCARRVQPLFDLPESFPERMLNLRHVESILSLVEEHARCETVRADLFAAAASAYAAANPLPFANPPPSAAYAYAAARAAAAAYAAATAHAAADFAASDASAAATNAGKMAAAAAANPFAAAAAYAAAYSAAAAAAASSAEIAATAAAADYQHLLQLNLPANSHLDPTESGPLGPLWPAEPPDWYSPAKA